MILSVVTVIFSGRKSLLIFWKSSAGQSAVKRAILYPSQSGARTGIRNKTNNWFHDMCNERNDFLPSRSVVHVETSFPQAEILYFSDADLSPAIARHHFPLSAKERWERCAWCFSSRSLNIQIGSPCVSWTELCLTSLTWDPNDENERMSHSWIMRLRVF